MYMQPGILFFVLSELELKEEECKNVSDKYKVTIIEVSSTCCWMWSSKPVECAVVEGRKHELGHNLINNISKVFENFSCWTQ